MDELEQLMMKIEELEQRVDLLESERNELLTLTEPFVSGSPSVNGNIVITVNGRRIKVPTVS